MSVSDDARSETVSEIVKEMQEQGITHIQLSYSGAGDEGSFEEIAAFSSTSSAVDASAELESLVEGWGYDVLYDQFAGWEINEGSDGTITISLIDGAVKATISHNENIVTQRNEIVNLGLGGVA